MKLPLENRIGYSFANIIGYRQPCCRRALGGPNNNGQRIARQTVRRRRIEAGGSAPLRYFAVGEAKPAMCVLVTEKFERMGREVD